MKNHETNHTRKAAGGRPQGRTGHRAKQGKIAAAGAKGGAGKVGEGAFIFRPNKVTSSDGIQRKRSNGDNAADADEMLSTVPDAKENGPECTLTDALSNLLHWCDREGIVFDHALKMARIHHQAER